VAQFLPPEQGNFFVLKNFPFLPFVRFRTVFFLKLLGRSFVPVSGPFCRRFRAAVID
jgi:hypothetical protein